MKFILFFAIGLFLFSCASMHPSNHAKKHPGSHILTQDKKAAKDNLRHTKEQAKAARKKREDLASYEPNTKVSDHKPIKKVK